MKIYIPSHLRNIGVIEMLYQMIKNTPDTADSTDSFSDYRYTLRTDPVRKFLNLTYPSAWSEQDKENKINYLSSLFYSVKGTFKVLDYIIAFGILSDWEDRDSVNKITYSSRKISIHLKSIGTDKTLFCDYLEKFLCALLYFDELDITIDEISSDIADNAVISINSGYSYYTNYDFVEE